MALTSHERNRVLMQAVARDASGSHDSLKPQLAKAGTIKVETSGFRADAFCVQALKATLTACSSVAANWRQRTTRCDRHAATSGVFPAAGWRGHFPVKWRKPCNCGKYSLKKTRVGNVPLGAFLMDENPLAPQPRRNSGQRKVFNGSHLKSPLRHPDEAVIDTRNVIAMARKNN